MGDIKLIVFDWAGTTVDFGCIAPLKAFEVIFENRKINITKEEMTGPMGMGKRDHIKTLMGLDSVNSQWVSLIERPWTEDDIDEMYAEFQKVLFQELANYCKPIKGVVSTVNYLKKKGYHIGSTTGYTKEMMDVVINGAAKEGYGPDNVVTSELVGYGRPYPYMIFENMRKFGINSVEQVVKVGDTISDIKEGKNAGAISVGILRGSSLVGLTEEEDENLSDIERNDIYKVAREKYIAAGADYVLNDITKLPDLIEMIQG